MIEWRKEFSFGIEKIDKQHKEFLSLLNGFLSALKEGKGKDEVAKTFEFLNNYVIFHFEDEENFMKQMDFKKLNEHKKTHEKFKKEIKDLWTEIKSSGVNLSNVLKISKKLTDWYINHIGKEDREYAQFFKNK